jgi:hypothetical protein
LQHRGEEGHCVFEEVVGNLHDTRGVLTDDQLEPSDRLVVGLHDSDIWTLLHLESGVHEAVFRNPGIGINKKDDLSTTHQYDDDQGK